MTPLEILYKFVESFFIFVAGAGTIAVIISRWDAQARGQCAKCNAYNVLRLSHPGTKIIVTLNAAREDSESVEEKEGGKP